MKDEDRIGIGDALFGFQAALKQEGSSLQEYIERTLYTLLRGPKVDKIDDVTFFGKNPDSHQIYLF